jgi:hypothetical protein
VGEGSWMFLDLGDPMPPVALIPKFPCGFRIQTVGDGIASLQ